MRVVATYLNGRGERSQTDRSDLNVPFRLECVLTGRKRWLEDASAVEPLLACLRDEEEDVRREAAWALEQVPAQAPEPLA